MKFSKSDPFLYLVFHELGTKENFKQLGALPTRVPKIKLKALKNLICKVQL
jgi:hypothetical protein